MRTSWNKGFAVREQKTGRMSGSHRRPSDHKADLSLHQDRAPGEDIEQRQQPLIVNKGTAENETLSTLVVALESRHLRRSGGEGPELVVMEICSAFIAARRCSRRSQRKFGLNSAGPGWTYFRQTTVLSRTFHRSSWATAGTVPVSPDQTGSDPDINWLKLQERLVLNFKLRKRRTCSRRAQPPESTQEKRLGTLSATARDQGASSVVFADREDAGAT